MKLSSQGCFHKTIGEADLLSKFERFLVGRQAVDEVRSVPGLELPK